MIEVKPGESVDFEGLVVTNTSTAPRYLMLFDRQPGARPPGTVVHKGKMGEDDTACGRSIFEEAPLYLAASVRWEDVTCRFCLAIERERLAGAKRRPGKAARKP